METKSAFAALVGRPNVGKSSLMNRLLGEKVAIVTDRPQTTRTRITGVLTRGPVQLIFTDTPGLHRPKNKLGKYMAEQTERSVEEGDICVLVTEPSGGITEAERRLYQDIQAAGGHRILAINKVDTLNHKEALLPCIERWKEIGPFEEFIPLSARTGEGVDTLLDILCGMAEPSPHYFPEDTLTDQPERVISAEIIREKLLLNLRDEIPHGTAVVIEKMREREQGGILDMDAEIICEKKSHKGIIIGKGGAMLKKISSQARQDLERFLDCHINLQVWVRVREDWRTDERAMRALGFRTEP